MSSVVFLATFSDFFFRNTFKCQIDWIVGPDLGPNYLQTICEGYQQTALVGNELNIARSEEPHIALVIIRGLPLSEKRQNYESVKDFIILNQVVPEKTLMKNVHMCYIGVIEGKNENLKKKEGKMNISSLFSFTQCTLST